MHLAKVRQAPKHCPKFHSRLEMLCRPNYSGLFREPLPSACKREMSDRARRIGPRLAERQEVLITGRMIVGLGRMRRG
jgi:hypothetical protein